MANLAIVDVPKLSINLELKWKRIYRFRMETNKSNQELSKLQTDCFQMLAKFLFRSKSYSIPHKHNVINGGYIPMPEQNSLSNL
jgi:hypothetical protein